MRLEKLSYSVYVCAWTVGLYFLIAENIFHLFSEKKKNFLQFFSAPLLLSLSQTWIK